MTFRRMNPKDGPVLYMLSVPLELFLEEEALRDFDSNSAQFQEELEEAFAEIRDKVMGELARASENLDDVPVIGTPDKEMN